jgi:protein gp37
MGKTKIEWTESSWNPITGCTKVSAGCLNCYAERLAKRLQAMGQKNYSNGFMVTKHEDALAIPSKWHKPQMVFVCSMSDLFHEDVSDDFIHRVFAVMNEAKQHTFQVLTKRAERLKELAPEFTWTENIWAGVTVESNQYTDRIDCLRTVPATVRFLSLEPLLGPIEALDLTGIDWLIAGGESGPRARQMRADWASSIRDLCVTNDVPFFFKQWGGVNKKRAGRTLEGRTWDEIPCSTGCQPALG